MTEINPGAIIERAKNILLSPAKEWEKIAAERSTVKELFLGYAVIMAAIPAVCGFLGLMFFGLPMIGQAVKISFMGAMEFAVSSYVFGLLGIAITGYVINALAPTFQGEKNQVQAFKVAIYSMTAAWLAGIFSLVPILSILGLVGLYSVYLLYRGLPILMKAPENKALAFTATVIVIAIIVSLVASGISGAMLAPVATPIAVPQ